MNVYFSPAYAAAAFAFETTRKSQWVEDSLHHEPLPGVTLQTPEPLSLQLLLQVHDARYVDAVKTGSPRELAESQELTWDAGLWPMVLASNGGMVSAALDAMQHGISGTLSSGLHHARRDRGAGYCTFNGLVMAAQAALQAGAKRVLILDLDAHCGGGTASLIQGDTRICHVDISVHDYDQYPSCENSSLLMVSDPSRYLTCISDALDQLAADVPRPDLCLYNAGMDAYEHCSDGGLKGITRDILAKREAMVFDWCRQQRLPIAFGLAGGYLGQELDAMGLVALHRLTIAAAAQAAA